ncbi:hypothetical protein BDN72DRAFT_828758 [Pluteus cervinus]|uniref:Uncharacterized protein n=1 Tax=Pluteus cervinus TaxID=181527 RepID=A0ACD3A4Z3_9AGAR|nr:hypothetical protein BDN72DRAFT_828758 [Pluteus cervinus]
MPACPECGGTIIEYDTAAGNGFCISCGTVVEENTIVNEVVFGETSTGAAMVQGSFVGQGATHARMSGPYGNRGSNESREQTIANASRKIQSIANVLRLSETVCLAATRLYTLAVEHKFTKGRKSLNVVAVCLYVACRQKETRNYMLIDFSDLLQVNVFELGHTYLQLVQTLNLRLPLVDPSHYISRFASLLEFGEETSKVATDAIRLVQRFDRDWMTRGRRPAGICGAALLLAARMNNFRRSTEEIVQVVKIADSTVRKRLEEFRQSPSGNLTVEDFRRVWLEEEMDPPAFTKGREREEQEKERVADLEAEEAEEREASARPASPTGKSKGKTKKGKGKANDSKPTAKLRRSKRKRGQSDEDEDSPAPPDPGTRRPVDQSLLNQGILAGSLSTAAPFPNPNSVPVREPLFAPQPMEEDDDLRFNTDLTLGIHENVDMNIDPQLLGHTFQTTSVPGPSALMPPPPVPMSVMSQNPIPSTSTQEVLAEEAVSALVAEEVSQYLEGSQGIMIAEALDEAEERRRRLKRMEKRAAVMGLVDSLDVGPGDEGAQNQDGAILPSEQASTSHLEPIQAEAPSLEHDEEFIDDELKGLDEEELDRFLLSEDEIKIKERVWVELNRDYLEALAVKALQAESGVTTSKSRKRRKTANKPRDATTPHGSTAAESVRNLLKKNPKYSKRINYDALKDLFLDSGGVPGLPPQGGALIGTSLDDKDDTQWYTMDDKDDDVGPMVIIEGEGNVTTPIKEKPQQKTKTVLNLGAGVGVGEDEDAEGESDDEEKEPDPGWDEAFEQEV